MYIFIFFIFFKRKFIKIYFKIIYVLLNLIFEQWILYIETNKLLFMGWKRVMLILLIVWSKIKKKKKKKKKKVLMRLLFSWYLIIQIYIHYRDYIIIAII